MSYTEVMSLDVKRKNRFVEMLYGQLEKEQEAMAKANGGNK